MSYDIDLMIDTGGESPVSVYDAGNMTSNVSSMWARALGFPLRDMHERVAGDCIADLERAVSHIRHPDNREVYRAMNPANGWGDHGAAARYLENLLEGCRLHPKATIYVDC